MGRRQVNRSSTRGRDTVTSTLLDHLPCPDSDGSPSMIRPRLPFVSVYDLPPPLSCHSVLTRTPDEITRLSQRVVPTGTRLLLPTLPQSPPFWNPPHGVRLSSSALPLQTIRSTPPVQVKGRPAQWNSPLTGPTSRKKTFYSPTDFACVQD